MNRQRRLGAVISFALAIHLAPQRTEAANTSWTFGLDNTNSTWTATEATTGVNLSGTFTRPSGGFDVLNVGAALGSGAPTVGTNLYSLEVPGLALVTNPILAGDYSMVNAVVAGNCPTNDFNAIWVFSQWDQTGFNDMQSDYQPAFGTFSWNNTLSQGTVNNVYTPVLAAPISNFSPFTISGTCSGGAIPIAGVGDRGGTLYMSADGGGFFRTNGNKGMFLFPQVKIVTATALSGTYTAYHMVNGTYGINGTDGVNGSVVYQPMNITVGAWATGAQNGNIIDASDGSVVSSNFANFTIDQINSPTNGFLRATIYENGNHGQMTCAVYYGQQVTLFCAGQNPANTTEPLNFLMVSQNTAFTQYAGTLGGVNSFEYATPAVDSANADKIYVYGKFSAYAGVTVTPFIRIDATGAIDTTFSAPASLYFPTGLGLVLPAIDSANSGKLYAFAQNVSYQSSSATSLVRLQTNGAQDTTFTLTGSLTIPLAGVAAIDTPNLGRLYITDGGIVERILPTGAVDATFPTGSLYYSFPVNGVPYAMEVARDSANLGKFYIAGQFSQYGSFSNVGNLIRIQTDSSLDTGFITTNQGFNSGVSAVLAATDTPNLGKIYAAGVFTAYNSTSVYTIVRLNANGTLDSAFSAPGVPSAGYTVNGISAAIDGAPGQIYLALWGQSGGLTLRLNTDGSVDSTFSPAGAGIFGTNSVAQFGGTSLGKILITGITGYNNLGVGGVAIVATDGTIDTAFVNTVTPGVGLNGSVQGFAFAQDSANVGRVYVAGSFSSFNGTVVNNFARFNPNGTLDYSFNQSQTGPNSTITSIALPTNSADLGKVYIAGYHNSYNGTTVPSGITRLTATGAIDGTFNGAAAGVDLWVNALVLAFDSANLGKPYLGGFFSTYNGTTINNLARLLTNGALDTTFNIGGASNGTSDAVNAISAAVDSSNLGKVYIGGQFSTYVDSGGTHSANGIARIHTNGALDTSFATGTGFDSEVLTVAVAIDSPHLGEVYVGGYFAHYQGATATRVARLLTNGSLDNTFVAVVPANYFVSSIYPTGDSANLGKIYAAGYSTASGRTVTGVFRLNTNGSNDAAFAPVGCNVGCWSTYNVLAVSPNWVDYAAVYVGGSFLNYNFSNYGSGLVRLLPDGTLN